MNETMNTRFFYLYRDASNFKQQNSCVISGPITAEQRKALMENAYEGQWFIPEMVGLPEERPGPWTEDDHCWFEMTEDGFEETRVKPQVKVTAAELVERFKKAAENNWGEPF